MCIDLKVRPLLQEYNVYWVNYQQCYMEEAEILHTGSCHLVIPHARRTVTSWSQGYEEHQDQSPPHTELNEQFKEEHGQHMAESTRGVEEELA